MAKQKVKKEKIAVKQGKSKVGYKCPPKGNQFKPGESGNPAGPPVHRTQLWTYFCLYMALTNTEFEKLKKKQLSQSQRTAIKLIKDMKDGKHPRAARFAQYCIDRELGKAQEHVKITGEKSLSDEECEKIRGILRKNASGS